MIDTDFWDYFLEEFDKEEEELELETLVWCGCGNHTIDPTKDPYKQHNKWVEGVSTAHVEKNTSAIQNVKAIGASTPKQTHSYDFSGEEFEVDNDALRKFKNKS